MKTIIPPIRPSDRGDAVANLQQALTALNFSISNDERSAAFFGDTTTVAIRRFQESFHIPITGFVDEATAKALNDNLRNRQLLDKTFRASGHVYDAFGQPMMQATVVAFDVDLRGVPLIGTVTNIGETMQTNGFQWLGVTFTNTEGYYQVDFDAENFINSDKSHADVVVFLAQDDRIMDRSRLTTKRDYSENEIQNLDIRLAADAPIRGLPEYVMLINAISPILRMSDMRLTDIVNNTEQIDFLAQETDVETAKLLIAAQAEALLFGRTEVSGTDFIYALGRENVGLTFGEITDYTEGVLFDKIKSAISKNIILPKADDTIMDFVKRLLRLASSMVLNNTRSAPRPVQDLNRSLDLALTPALKNTFIAAQRQLETNADPQKFWNEILPQSGFDDAQIQSLKIHQSTAFIDGRLHGYGRSFANARRHHIAYKFNGFDGCGLVRSDQ